MKFKSKINWEKITKDELIKNRLKLGALFFLGFLIGMMLKSQAARTIVAGYDDSEALTSDEIQLKDSNLEVLE
jgi:hypothetical protein